MRRLIVLPLAAAALLAPAAAQAAPTVYAAASLRAAFPEIDSAPTYNFAGSNVLQRQIESGAPADVFAVGQPEGGAGAVRGGPLHAPGDVRDQQGRRARPGEQPGAASARSTTSTAGAQQAAGGRRPRACRSATTRGGCCSGCGSPRSSPATRSRSRRNVANITAKVALGISRRRLHVQDRRHRRRQPREEDQDPQVGAAAGALPDVRRAAAGRRHRGRAGVHPQGDRRARAARRCASGTSACRRGADTLLRAAFTALLALCLGVVLAFLAVPIVALFAEVPLRDVPGLLREPAVRDAIATTARTNAVANVLILGFGTPAAYLLATRRFRGRALVVTRARAAARAAARRGRDRAARRVRRRRAVRRPSSRAPGIVLPVHASGPSCSPSRSWPRRSTCARRSPRSRASTRRSPTPRARSAPRRCARSRGSRCRSPPAGWPPAGCSRSRAGRRVRRHDPVRRQRPRRDPDAHARRLRAARGRLRRRARDRHPARRAQRRRAALLQAPLALAQLELDINVPLRAFSVDVALTVGGETLALVGPSGAGKTTVLRCVAGLHRPARGRIALGDDVWFDSARRIDRPPDRRSVGLVFQEYALFPHMTRARRTSASAAATRVDDLLGRLGIAHLAAREARAGCRAANASVSPSPARSPATRRCCCSTSRSPRSTRTRAPSVREQLADLLAELAIPALLVTHDFTDAAALADTRRGRARRPPAPARDARPNCSPAPPTRFVASLTGGNLLTGDRDSRSPAAAPSV